jgi:hypothetical protein
MSDLDLARRTTINQLIRTWIVETTDFRWRAANDLYQQISDVAPELPTAEVIRLVALALHRLADVEADAAARFTVPNLNGGGPDAP